MSFWSQRRVLVTGGGGFIGSHVTELLVAAGAQVTVADHTQSLKHGHLQAVQDRIRVIDTDLREMTQCQQAFRDQQVVLHLAAQVGGIRFNVGHHGTILRNNLLLAVNVLESARQIQAERVLLVSSACVYSRRCSIPTLEEEGFFDLPEPTNLGYGWSKRTAELLGQAYAKEFGMRIAIARPTNAYGPRDHFESPDAHVIAALIRRLSDGENPLTVWGDGQQMRSFIYVTDLARGLIELIEKYPVADPVNLGTAEEVSVRTLAELIVELSGKRVPLQFDDRQPSGQPRRYCDPGKAARVIGFKPQVSLREGLARTLAWYLQRGRASAALLSAGTSTSP